LATHDLAVFGMHRLIAHQDNPPCPFLLVFYMVGSTENVITDQGLRHEGGLPAKTFFGADAVEEGRPKAQEGRASSLES